MYVSTDRPIHIVLLQIHAQQRYILWRLLDQDAINQRVCLMVWPCLRDNLPSSHNNIVKALGIDGCINIPCAWSYRPTSKTLADEDADEDLKQGAQIDLLIDRSDKSISICEMKYCQGEYEINKAYEPISCTALTYSRKWPRLTRPSSLPSSLHTDYIIICMQEK